MQYAFVQGSYFLNLTCLTNKDIFLKDFTKTIKDAEKMQRDIAISK